MADVRNVGRLSKATSGGAAADVGEPPGGSNYTALHVISTQTEETNSLLSRLIDQNEKILSHLALITGLSNE